MEWETVFPSKEAIRKLKKGLRLKKVEGIFSIEYLKEQLFLLSRILN
jgi:hypothetical protein